MFTIAQISDFHVSTAGSMMERDLRTGRRLELAVAHLNGLSRCPDAVLATGDLVEGGTAAEYAEVRARLDRLKMPWFVIPGNHDNRHAMHEAFSDQGYFDDDPTFLHYAVEDFPLRLVALDTVIPGQTSGTLCQQRLDWLEATLSAAPERPTLVYMHHPPLRSGIVKMDVEGFDATAALEEVIARHPQVEAVLAGHIHRAIDRRYAGSIVATCPSTSHQLGLDLSAEERLTIVLEPPAYRLHVWHGPEDGLVSHVVHIQDDFPRAVVFEGGKWQSAKLSAPPEL